MNWKDSVLKPNQVKWNIKTNRQDDSFDLTIPLQPLLELQAKRSFAAGIAAALVAIDDASKAGKVLDVKLGGELYEQWGLADLWQKSLKGIVSDD